MYVFDKPEPIMPSVLSIIPYPCKIYTYLFQTIIIYYTYILIIL